MTFSSTNGENFEADVENFSGVLGLEFTGVEFDPSLFDECV
jgi:hypothetical protein